MRTSNPVQWRNSSRSETESMHAESRYAWIPRDLSILGSLEFSSLPELGSFVNKKRTHQMSFFRLLFHWQRHNSVSRTDIVRVWNEVFVQQYGLWMDELDSEDEIWFSTIDGLKFFIHWKSITEGIPCAIRQEFCCPIVQIMH